MERVITSGNMGTYAGKQIAERDHPLPPGQVWQSAREEGSAKSSDVAACHHCKVASSC